MENNNESRKISTVQFGEVTVEKKHIFNFPNGILGFEDLREFVLISEEETVPFKNGSFPLRNRRLVSHVLALGILI